MFCLLVVDNVAIVIWRWRWCSRAS